MEESGVSGENLQPSVAYEYIYTVKPIYIHLGAIFFIQNRQVFTFIQVKLTTTSIIRTYFKFINLDRIHLILKNSFNNKQKKHRNLFVIFLVKYK